MTILRAIMMLAAAAAMTTGTAQITSAHPQVSVGKMKANCRARAGRIFRTRLPNISTKYEGQRVDGTHAVNGTFRHRRQVETFQCSFNRSGRRIIRFIVN